jgi:hypothetical protein
VRLNLYSLFGLHGLVLYLWWRSDIKLWQFSCQSWYIQFQILGTVRSSAKQKKLLVLFTLQQLSSFITFISSFVHVTQEWSYVFFQFYIHRKRMFVLFTQMDALRFHSATFYWIFFAVWENGRVWEGGAFICRMTLELRPLTLWRRDQQQRRKNEPGWLLSCCRCYWRMSLRSATDVYGRDMHTSLCILEVDVNNHVFQPGGILRIDEEVSSVLKQLQRKIRDWPGICLLQGEKRLWHLCFVWVLPVASCHHSVITTLKLDMEPKTIRGTPARWFLAWCPSWITHHESWTPLQRRRSCFVSSTWAY